MADDDRQKGPVQTVLSTLELNFQKLLTPRSYESVFSKFYRLTSGALQNQNCLLVTRQNDNHSPGKQNLVSEQIRADLMVNHCFHAESQYERHDTRLFLRGYICGGGQGGPQSPLPSPLPPLPSLFAPASLPRAPRFPSLRIFLPPPSKKTTGHLIKYISFYFSAWIIIKALRL